VQGGLGIGFDGEASRAIMAAAWEEPSMRKLIGLCFLTATLLATSAHAQGIFIDRGDPNAVSAAIGGGLAKDAYAGSLVAGWTYRGVFDAGADFTYFKYTAGNNKNLNGFSLTPFVTWHALRVDEDEMPIALSFTLAVQREMFTGNTPVAAPEAWGVFAGASVWRRFEFGTSLVFIPEVVAGLDVKDTRYYSTALDQASGNVRDTSGGSGYSADMKYRPRVLVRPNLLVKAGNTKYVIMPYAGYQDGFAAGANVGALF
jgi:hypothetical protein